MSLFVSLSLFLLCGFSVMAGSQTLSFRDGDLIQTDHIIVKDKQLILNSELLNTPTTIPLKLIQEITFGEADKKQSAPYQLIFKNGNSLQGKLLSQSSTTLTFLPDFSDHPLETPLTDIQQINTLNKNVIWDDVTDTLSNFKALPSRVLPEEQDGFLIFTSGMQSASLPCLGQHEKIHLSFEIRSSRQYTDLTIYLWDSIDTPPDQKKMNYSVNISSYQCVTFITENRNRVCSISQAYWDNEQMGIIRMEPEEDGTDKLESCVYKLQIDLFVDVKTGATYYFVNNESKLSGNSYQEFLNKRKNQGAMGWDNEPNDSNSHENKSIERIRDASQRGDSITISLESLSRSSDECIAIGNFNVKEWDGTIPTTHELKEQNTPSVNDSPDKEIVVLTNGDTSKGKITLLDSGSFAIQSDNYQVELPADKIARIQYPNNTPKEQEPKAQGDFLLRTKGKSKVTGELISINDQEVVIKIANDYQFKCPIEKVNVIKQVIEKPKQTTTESKDNP